MSNKMKIGDFVQVDWDGPSVALIVEIDEENLEVTLKRFNSDETILVPMEDLLKGDL